MINWDLGVTMKKVFAGMAVAGAMALSGCAAYDESQPGSKAVYEALQANCGNLANYSQSFIRNGSDDESYFYRVEAGGQVGEVHVRHWPDLGLWKVSIFEDSFVSSWGCSSSIMRWQG
mgnify:CR=1 FL=1|jgi:hypothetical protein